MLLLNPDVTVPDGFLDDVLASVESLSAADPKAGVVGFRLRNPDGSGQASAGPFPTLRSTLGGYCCRGRGGSVGTTMKPVGSRCRG